MDFIFLAGFNTPNHPVERSSAGMVNSVPVVKFLRPVDAYAEKKLIIAKEFAPFIIQQNPVGLKGIANLLAGTAVLFL